MSDLNLSDLLICSECSREFRPYGNDASTRCIDCAREHVRQWLSPESPPRAPITRSHRGGAGSRQRYRERLSSTTTNSNTTR